MSWEMETANSVNDITKYWNHQIHLWLKNYVQQRVVKPGTRAGMKENLLVFMTSAFWHGFYPFYYVMFLFSYLFAEITKDVYRSRILVQWIPYPVRYAITWFFTYMIMNYLAMGFNQLTFEKGGNFLKSTHYFGYIFIIVVFTLLRFSGVV